MFSHYGPLCTAVYQLTKPVGSALNGDIDYYEERLSGIEGPILEIGVGTGRMMIPLLEAGLEMTGLDNSQDMLALCEQHLKEANLTATTLVGDFCSTIQGQYQAVIIPTATFNLISDDEQAMSGLTNIFNCLRPGGRLILDLDLPFYPEVGEVVTTTFPLTNQEGIIMENKTLGIDWLSQQVVSHIRYEKWSSGQLIATELQDLTLKWYGLEEFKLILEKIGFTHISITGDYDYGSQPTDANQTITFEATKP